jgi:hypothetical protein
MTNFVPKDHWEIIPRINITVRVPHGYKTDPSDNTIFVPDLAQIEWLEKALDYVDDGNSFRAVAEWYTDQTGRKISHQGIKIIWEKHRKHLKTNERAAKLKQATLKRRPKTKEEKEVQQLKRKVVGAKLALKKREAKLAELTKPEIAAPAINTNPTPIVIEDGREVVFEPNEGPQTAFLAAPEQEVLYGGAAGGGKSYAMLADPMRYFDNPNFNGILFRKTNDELRELKQKSRPLYTKAFPGARWKEQDSAWIFPSGAQMWLTYLDRDQDVERYQGQAFTWVGFDELGHWATPYAWNYMRSRLRSTDPNIPLSQRATANPGGVGGWWIKKMFIDPAPFNVTFPATDIESGEVLVWPDDHKDVSKRGQPLFYRRFIPAKLSDNPYLYDDGRYEASLLSLPEEQRRQLLDGDWNVTEGAAFKEFKLRDHVIEPFEIPSHWKRFRSCDYGYSSFSAVHWFAIDPVYETLIVYRELYVKGCTGKELAKKILELEQDEHIMYGILDSSVWQQRGQTGPSIAEEMIKEGCRWRPADRTQGSRTNGKNRLHELLRVKDVGISEISGLPIMKPGIQFFNTCRQIITDLPMLPVHPDGKEDIDDRYLSDHTYDSIRYGVMSRPRAMSPFDFGAPSFERIYRPADRKLGY